MRPDGEIGLLGERHGTSPCRAADPPDATRACRSSHLPSTGSTAPARAGCPPGPSPNPDLSLGGAAALAWVGGSVFVGGGADRGGFGRVSPRFGLGGVLAGGGLVCGCR